MSDKVTHNKSVSIAKGIGIILMVIGHGGCPSQLNHFIYMFHMPLFFFISGYLFSDKYIDNKATFLKRKIHGLYIPFIKFEIIFLALHGLFFLLGMYDYNYTLKEYAVKFLRILFLSGGEQLLGGYWYLIQALYSSILALLLISCMHVYNV